MVTPIDRLFSIDLKTDKAIKSIEAFEARYSQFEKRMSEGLKGKNAFDPSKKLIKTTKAIASQFGNLEKISEQSMMKIINGFVRAGHAADVFKAKLNSREIKNSGALKELNSMLGKIDRETTSVAKKVAKFLGPDIGNATKSTTKEIDKLASKSKKAGNDIYTAGKKGAKGVKEIDLAAKVSSLSLIKLASKFALTFGAFQGIRKTISDTLDFEAVLVSASAKFSTLQGNILKGTQGFEDLKKIVRDLTKETEFNIVEVSKAVDFYAKAGKTAEQTKLVLPVTLDFASSTGTAVGEAGDILSDVAGQFNLDSSDPQKYAENITRISNVMAKGALSANLSVTEMFESFKQAGPVLSAAGLQIEDVTSLTAALANAGIKSSKAGMALKTMAVSLISPTEKQKDIYKKLNIQTKDTEGNFRNFTDILSDVDKATKKMGSGDRLDIFAELIGREGLPGFINLLNTGKLKLDGFADSLNEVDGFVKNTAEEIRKAEKIQFSKFLSKLEDIGISLFEKTKLFTRLNTALKNVDFKYVANLIDEKIVPAFEWMFEVLKNSIIPAFQEIYVEIKDIVTPIFEVLTDILGSTGTEGDNLKNVIKGLLRAFIAFKIVGFISSMGSVVSSLGGVSTAATGAGTAVTSFATAFSWAAGVIQAGLVGWSIGKFIYDEVVDPIIKANFEMKRLQSEVDDLMNRDISKRNSDQLKKDLESVNKLAEKLDNNKTAVAEEIFKKTGQRFKVERDDNELRVLALKKRIEDQLTLNKTTEAGNKLLNDQNQVTEQPKQIGLTSFDDVDPFDIQSVDTGIRNEPNRKGPTSTDFGWNKAFEELTNQTVNTINEKLDLSGFQKLPEFDFDIAQTLSQEMSGSVSPALLDMSNNIATQNKQVEQYNQQLLGYQRQLVEASKAQKSGTTNNIDIGPTSVTMNIQGGDAKEIERTVNKVLNQRDKEQVSNIKRKLNSLGSGEF